MLGFLVLSEAPGGLFSSTHTQASAQAQRRVSRAGAQASASLLGDGPLHVPEAAKARPPAQHEGESPGHALPSSLPHDPIQAGAWGGLCLLLTLSFPSVPLTTSLPLFLCPSFLSPAHWPRSLTLIPSGSLQAFSACLRDLSVGCLVIYVCVLIFLDSSATEVSEYIWT